MTPTPEPITVTETVSLGTRRQEKAWTYEALLDTYDDDYNVVKPLVQRCMSYEEKLAAVRAECEFQANDGEPDRKIVAERILSIIDAGNP
jgi:hypothetical protein